MANPGVILLILLIIVLTIIMAILISRATIAYINSLNTGGGGGGGTGTIILSPCTANISSLIQIGPNVPNCIQNNKQTSLFYVGNLPGGENLDYVVAPWKTQPLNVCIGFCRSFNNGVCTGDMVNGVSAQDNFNKCMAQLSRTDCQPPAPIAARGTILYYPESPTCRTCANVCFS